MKKQFPFTNAYKSVPNGLRLTIVRLTACTLMLTLLVFAAPFGAAGASVERHYTSASPSAQERIAGNLLNSDRARYALAPLTLDPTLCRIARIKSQDMRDNQYFAHTSPTYGDVREMLRAFNYNFIAAAENIANHATVEKSQAALISSPGHRRNILSPTYTKVGIGIAQDDNGYVYLTQIFCR